MIAVWLYLMWSESHLMRARLSFPLHLIWSQNCLDYGSEWLWLQSATDRDWHILPALPFASHFSVLPDIARLEYNQRLLMPASERAKYLPIRCWNDLRWSLHAHRTSKACLLGNRLNSSCISTLHVHPYSLILSTTVVLVQFQKVVKYSTSRSAIEL